MIALDTTTKSLQIVLAGAKNTNDATWIASYEKIPVIPGPGMGTQQNPVVTSAQGATNGVTAVTIMPAPGAGFVHRLKSFNLFNADLAAITASLQMVDSSGPTTTVFQKVTKQTLECLNYEDGYGWDSLDVNGAVIAQAPTTSANVSTAQLLATSAWSVLTQINAPASVLSTSSQASSIAAGIVVASINSVSSQASSLATAVIPASVNSVSSQASSMALSFASVSSNASLGSLGSSLASSLLTRWSVTISKTSSSFSF